MNVAKSMEAGIKNAKLIMSASNTRYANGRRNTLVISDEGLDMLAVEFRMFN